ncbi:sensor histidine kinase [Actinomadura scrupuli]|uniref:sensor histidine kinase n=1 Tax=Actinomadura scrupuli TaxID=559629 RepID=UPI003D98FD19
MSSTERPATSARLGATFRLLLKFRIVLAGMSLVWGMSDRLTVAAVIIVIGVGLLSWLILIGWEQIAPWLMRFPVLLGFDGFVCYAPMQVGGVLGPFFLVTVVTSAGAGLLHRWSGVLLVCGSQMVLYYAAAAAGHTDINFQTAVAMPAFYPIAALMGMALRRLFDDYAALDDAHRRAEVLNAAAEERNRLAREMHDSLAKTLRGIAMAVTALPVWVEKSPERAGLESARIAAAIEIASREARELITGLRDGAIRQPLGTSIVQIARSVERSADIIADAHVDMTVELPLLARYELSAILGEALENVVRHAHATRVKIRLATEGSSAVLTIRDDGAGFEAEADPEFDEMVRAGHYGLIGMRERAVRVGGTLTVSSRPGEGTTLTVVVPLETSADQDTRLTGIR